MRYRIYDKENKVYVSLEDYYVSGNGDVLHFVHRLNTTFSQDRFIIERSTGLFDKNGKEIYEGDRVKYSNLINPVIRFNQGAFGIFEDERMIYTTFIGINTNDIEVIGNIHDKE